MLGIDRIQLCYDALCRGLIDFDWYRGALARLLERELICEDEYQSAVAYGAQRRYSASASQRRRMFV